MSALVEGVAMRDESENTNIEIQTIPEMPNFISKARTLQH
jgi:hypothetical protein